ncbi:MAG TPA: hypothetical protein VNH11_08535 [Pirellulales bacterium]|nr:hypothetical protein [Pirellulales bacterium]
MPRPQFTLRALLVAMLVVAAFFGGMVAQKRLDQRVIERSGLRLETTTMPDGTFQTRLVDPGGNQLGKVRD